MKKRKTDKISCVIQERDQSLILFLWKWKVATSSHLIHKFFPGVKPSTAYRRLWVLENAKMLQSICSPLGGRFVWTLGKAGFEVAKTFHPMLREDGYKSEHVTHDLLVSAFQHGPFALSGFPEDIRTFSEQQLRRYEIESFPAWVPKSERRRPDGYSLFIHDDEKSTKVAFEVELHHKAQRLYHELTWFYSIDKVVDQVWWLVGKESIAHSIWNVFRENGNHSKTEHYFITVDDFKAEGLRAKTIGGTKDQIPLCCALPQYQKFFKTSSQHDLSAVTLNIVKTPHRSIGSKILSLTDFGNCMGV